VIKLGELVVVLDLHRQGLSVSAPPTNLVSIESQSGPTSPKGLEPPVYKKRAPRPGTVDRTLFALAADPAPALKRQRVSKAQVDFARLEVEFVDEPGSSASSGWSRWCWATHGRSGRASSSIRICKQSFAVISGRGDRLLRRPLFSPGSKASSNGGQYACRPVDDGYGLLSLALPQWIFDTLIG
jgi:hypothetical protein